METAGSLSVLNVGFGDITVSFNNQDDVEFERAMLMLTDLQKRGYALCVRMDDGTYVRATSINRETKSYVVLPPRDVPPTPDHATTVEQFADDVLVDIHKDVPNPFVEPPKKRGRKPGKREYPVRTRKAVAVARSAGGCAPRSPLVLLWLARQARRA